MSNKYGYEKVKSTNQSKYGYENVKSTEEPQAEPEEQFLAPKKEGLGTTLPRDIMIGLSKLGHKTQNLPYDLVKNIEEQGQSFGNETNQFIPLEKYAGKNRLPNNKSYLQQIAEQFNKENNIPESEKNPNWNGSISERIPHQQEYDFAKLLGQEGTPSTGSEIIQKGIEYAPELISLASLARHIPLGARGIMNRMSGHKQRELNEARTNYSNLFNEATNEGVSHVMPPESAIANRQRISANSQTKYHRSLNEYLHNPTLENAHWAQSELGALERHLDSIANKTGLTPSQHRTLRAAQQTRNDIRQGMMSDNALGRHPNLAEEYQNLSNRYREDVVPYTRLEELSETEANRMRPRTAVKNLLKDEQFMIDLAHRYPGMRLHSKGAKNIMKSILGTGATIGGYEGLKKLLK